MNTQEIPDDYNKKNKDNDLFNAMKAAGLKILSNDETRKILKALEREKEKHINENDLERLADLEKKTGETYDKAEEYLYKYNIGESLEDIIYDFYKMYRKNNTLTISENMKLAIKGQLKFRIENLIRSINNDPQDIKKNLAEIMFIMSDKYCQQTLLNSILAKDVQTQITQGNNVAFFLSDHENYKKLYKNTIKGLSQVNEMKNIKSTLKNIYDNWVLYSNQEKKEINLRICHVWDLGLQYNINRELYTGSNLKSLIIRYQQIESKIK